ncbi:MAG: metallophosphoesterase [Paracoccaceae bacterium]
MVPGILRGGQPLNTWLQQTLRRLCPKRSGATLISESFGTLPCPETPVAVIGDIHGRADLLNALLAVLAKQAPGHHMIFVGDYVDRGPDSAAVIEKLRTIRNATCLCGNHEMMMLEFLDDPIAKGGRWLRNGGIATLNSYGITLADNSSTDIIAASTQLRTRLADGTENWLRALTVSWQSGNLLVTHAGPDPAQPIPGQEDDVFLWGHKRFLRDPRHDGIWVAHGHWARKAATVADGRIGVDTGAWSSGILTAALITPDGDVNFVDSR